MHSPGGDQAAVGRPSSSGNSGDGADIGSSSRALSRGSALSFRVPLSDRLDAGWKIRRLAQSQQYARDTEREGRGRSRMQHGRRAPHSYRNGKCDARAELVQQTPRQEQTEPIGDREGRCDVAVFNGSPADTGFERVGQEA